MARAELVKDPTFQQLLRQLQDALVRDHLEEEVKTLNLKLMDSMRRAAPNTDNGRQISVSAQVA